MQNKQRQQHLDKYPETQIMLTTHTVKKTGKYWDMFVIKSPHCTETNARHNCAAERNSNQGQYFR